MMRTGEKKIAIVTGASSGMGRECVIQLADRFAGLEEIWVIARRGRRLDAGRESAGSVKSTGTGSSGGAGFRRTGGKAGMGRSGGKDPGRLSWIWKNRLYGGSAAG